MIVVRIFIMNISPNISYMSAGRTQTKIGDFARNSLCPQWALDVSLIRQGRNE